jgi:hypothetical protein
MANVQKEMGQLENWLINIQPQPLSGVHTSDSQHNSVENQLSIIIKKLDDQEKKLSSMAERISMLESIKEIHVDNNVHWSLWDSMSNESSDEESTDSYKDNYNIIKHSTPSVSSQESEDLIVSAIMKNMNESYKKVEDEDEDDEDECVKEALLSKHNEVISIVTDKNTHSGNNVTVAVVDVAEVAAVAEVEDDEDEGVEVEEEVVEEEVVEDEDDGDEVEVEEDEDDDGEKEDEVEDEEEEGVELTEIEYNGVTYYKDPEDFVYSMTDDGELSENPVGYWKEKGSKVVLYSKAK